MAVCITWLCVSCHCVSCNCIMWLCVYHVTVCIMWLCVSWLCVSCDCVSCDCVSCDYRRLRDFHGKNNSHFKFHIKIFIARWFRNVACFHIFFAHFIFVNWRKYFHDENFPICSMCIMWLCVSCDYVDRDIFTIKIIISALKYFIARRFRNVACIHIFYFRTFHFRLSCELMKIF